MRKLTLLLLCCLLLTGCGAKSPQPTSAAETVVTVIPAVPETTAPETTAPETTAPETVWLTVYSPDDNTQSFVKTEVEVDAITEPAIVQQLILAGVLAEGTKVNLLELGWLSDAPDQTQLRVDFNVPLRERICSMGTSGEYVILGSVVNTFLTAYDADSIVITVDGDVLESGHAVYDQPLTFFEGFE